MTYLLLKGLHVSCVLVSYSLFLLRGIWSISGSGIMRQRWVRVVPHVVDTVLLSSAIALAFTIRQFPFVDSWLTAKVAGLLLYIGLGSVALKYGRTRKTRVVAWLAAQAAFALIVLIAVHHTATPFLVR